MSRENPWGVVGDEVRYENDWIRVRHHDVTNPAGNRGIYGVVEFKNVAIGIVPLDVNLDTWLVGQYRFPTDEYSWEIPEGGCPIGTDPLASAQRELREETGLLANDWTQVLEMRLSNCVSDERGLVYVARNLTPGESEPEETEKLSIWKLPLKRAFQMVLDGRITDAMSVAALLKVKWQLDNGRL